MPRLLDLPDELFTDPVALTVLEACAAYGGDAPLDALQHGVALAVEAAGEALEALQRRGVLEGGRTGAWTEAAQALLADDPAAPELLEGLCRYEGAVLQGWLLVSRDQVRPELAPRAEAAERLLSRAVARAVARAAADLAGTILASYARQGVEPERLLGVADLEVEAAGRTGDPARFDRALANRAAISSAAGLPDRALANRLRQNHAPSLWRETLITARTAMEARRPEIALTLLNAAWQTNGEENGDERLEIGLMLAQVLLEMGRPGRARDVLDAIADVRTDGALLSAVADEAAEVAERARAVMAAIQRALDAGPPEMGRVVDRWVRLVRAAAVPVEVLVLVANRAAGDLGRGQRRATFAVIQAFLGLWATSPKDPETRRAAERADEVTGGRWEFREWL